MWSVCENNVWISSMWNSRCFAIHWGLSTYESPCETPCEVYEDMCECKWAFTCESLRETPHEVYVKICVKGMTSLHTLFTYISLCKISHACEICVWNACEKCVKNVWKTCEKSVKIGHFSHVFHMVFHIHTPSSVVSMQPPLGHDKVVIYRRWTSVDCKDWQNKAQTRLLNVITFHFIISYNKLKLGKCYHTQRETWGFTVLQYWAFFQAAFW